jgi:hypothetical protein
MGAAGARDHGSARSAVVSVSSDKLKTRGLATRKEAEQCIHLTF